jgi:hypothetical protein
MGDSDIVQYLSAAALILVLGAVVAFVIAWRVRTRAVRVIVGVMLLVVAALCAIFSFLASLVVAALGVASLILAVRAPTRGRAWPETPREAEP